MDHRKIVAIIVCDKAGRLMDGTLSSLRDGGVPIEIVAIGSGLHRVWSETPRQSPQVVDIKGRSVAAEISAILSSVEATVVIAREGVLFPNGSLDGLVQTSDLNRMSVVTPPCRMAGIEFVGSSICIPAFGPTSRFDDVFGLRPRSKGPEIQHVACVFPGCYAFDTKWFNELKPWKGLLGARMMPHAISMASWLGGGSCSASQGSVMSASWCGTEEDPVTWEDYLDKIRIVHVMSDPRVAGKVVMCLPECDAKRKAIMELQSRIGEVMAEKRRFEFAASDPSIAEKIGIKI